MAQSNLKGVIVASGTWFYDGTIRVRTFVVARPCEVQSPVDQAGGEPEEGQPRALPGPDGLHYYVSGRGPFATLAEAQAWAERAWGPIRWDSGVKQFFLRLVGSLGAVP